MLQSFTTSRLLLRPTTEQDAAFILELLNTPKWLRYIGNRHVHSLDDAKAYIQKRITSQFDRLGYANYTVIRQQDGRKIGSCGLYDRKELEGIDIGFAFLPDYEGQGYAYEAAHRIKEAAIHDFRITTIRAITTKDNSASQKLLRKLGFRAAGSTVLPDDDVELLVYELTTT